MPTKRDLDVASLAERFGLLPGRAMELCASMAPMTGYLAVEAVFLTSTNLVRVGIYPDDSKVARRIPESEAPLYLAFHLWMEAWCAHGQRGSQSAEFRVGYGTVEARLTVEPLPDDIQDEDFPAG
ncbi:hypothetical protein [Falsiroseomonas sp.]|uniref:hypothetical protein n=1 Tax=Falsiroseomonas sp. TaxID=2870721 RepID=UPI003F6E8552